MEKQLSTNVMQEWFDLRYRLFKLKLLDLSTKNVLKGLICEEDFLEEHGTLNLNFGRQTGNTTFAKSLFQALGGSLLVCHNQRMVEHVLRDMPYYLPHCGSVCTLRQFCNLNFVGYSFRYLIFDASECIAWETKDSIPAIASRLKAEMIVYC